MSLLARLEEVNQLIVIGKNAGAEDDPETEDIDEASTWAPIATDEAFRAGAEALGLEVSEREWLEQSEVSTGDTTTMTPVDRIFRSQQSWYEVESGGVPAPARSLPDLTAEEDSEFRRWQSAFLHYAPPHESSQRPRSSAPARGGA